MLPSALGTLRKPQDGPAILPVPLPINGVADVFPFAGIAEGVCPPANMLNAWPQDTAGKLNRRLGMRPRLTPLFTNANGDPWQAPSYIQGFGQVNIAEQTRIEVGSLATAILQEAGGGGTAQQVSAPPRDLTLIDNLNYSGNLSSPPPTFGAADYQTYFGGGEAVVGGETPTGIITAASRWDRFAALNSITTHGQDQLIVAHNYSVTDAGLGKTIARTRLVSLRKNLTTLQYEFVNEYELSDGGHTGAPTHGKLSFSRSTDANKPWHILLNDIDIGETYIYAAVIAYQTSNDNHTGTVTARRGWAIAIQRSEFDPEVSPHVYPPSGVAWIQPWAQDAVSIRYRPVLATPITVAGITYGDTPDVLVLFTGYRDHWSGIGRYNDNLSSRLRIGELPTWANPGHGPLLPTYTGQTPTQLDTAGAAALIDGDHLTCRFGVVTQLQRGTLRADTTNDMSVRWTHGCMPLSMDVDHTSGDIFVARTAVGFGVANPDGSGSYVSPSTYSNPNLPNDTIPHVSVMSLTPAGFLNWEVDTGTRLHTGGWTSSTYGPFYNDRIRPTLNWISADQHGGALVVGRWALNKNVWHVKASSTTSQVGTVDWFNSIGIPNGRAKDSAGKTTRLDDFGETVGLAELTLYYCDAHKGNNQYVVTGTPFAPSTAVDILTYNTTGPSPGNWMVLAFADAAGKVAAFAGGTIWKLNQNGVSLWKRYLGDLVTVGITAEMITPIDATGSGAFVAFGHTRLSGTTAAASAGWTWDTAGKFWWLRNEAPPTRQVVIFGDELGLNKELVLGFKKRVHEIKVLVKSSGDGNDGYEIGTHNDVGVWKLVIRKVTAGIPDTSFIDSALLSDLNLTTDNQAFTIKVRVQGTTIEGFVSTQTDPEVAAVSATITAYFAYNRIGFSSNFQTTSTGAENQPPYTDPTAKIVKVTSADIFTLIPHKIAEGQVLCIFSDGRLFVVKTGDVVEEIAGLNFPPYGLIKSAQHRQKLRIVHSKGGYAKVYDPAADDGIAITNWTPTAGSLPGATSNGVGGYVAGTTTATDITMHLDRVYLFGMPEDIQNMEYSTLGDSDNWDKDSTLPFGKASNLSNEVSGVVGVPIISAYPYSDDRMVIGSDTQINALFGDPEFESARVDNVTREAGLKALTFADGGEAVVLTEQGTAIISGASIDFFSKDRLSKIATPSTHDGTLHTLAIRIANRYGTLFTYTRLAAEMFNPADVEYYSAITTLDADHKEVAITSTHLWFSELTKGFYPIQFDSAADPIAVFKYGEQVLLGGKDGYIRTFYDLRQRDFTVGSSAIDVTCYFPSGLIVAKPAMNSYKMVREFTILATDSFGTPKLYMKSAGTPEELYAQSPTSGIENDLTPGRNLFYQRLSDTALLLTYYGTSPFAVELLEVGLREAGLRVETLADVAPVQPGDDNLGVCTVSTTTGIITVSSQLCFRMDTTYSPVLIYSTSGTTSIPSAGSTEAESTPTNPTTVVLAGAIGSVSVTGTTAISITPSVTSVVVGATHVVSGSKIAAIVVTEGFILTPSVVPVGTSVAGPNVTIVSS